jgi:hypothetical protein
MLDDHTSVLRHADVTAAAPWPLAVATLAVPLEDARSDSSMPIVTKCYT